MRARNVIGTLALLAGIGCGGKTGVDVPPFNELVIGPGGGDGSAGTVKLHVPPGAFVDPTVVAILPEAPDLPLDPQAPPLTYMPGVMCIGPLGFPLFVDGSVTICYDPNDLPPGATENDLVLLEWDNAAGLMRIASGKDVVHDFVLHCFTDLAYDALGHVAVGVRLGFDFVAFVQPTPPAAVVPLGVVLPAPGLLLARTDGSKTPLPLPGTDGAHDYVASRNGARVLHQVAVVQAEQELLRTSDVANGTLHTLRDLGDPNFQSQNPFTGWLDGDRAWMFESRFDGQTQQFAPVFQDEAGDASTPREDLHGGPPGMFVRDVRISPDGTMALLRYVGFGDGVFEQYDVVDTTTGAPIGLDLPFASASTSPTPRWLPDSSALYFVDDKGSTVLSLTPDGLTQTAIYTLGAAGVLQDFVVSPRYAAGDPGGSPCAYVRGDPGVGAVPVPHSLLGVDVLSGDSSSEEDLLEVVDVAELVYHPDGATVWADLFEQSRVIGIGLGLVLPSPETSVCFDAVDASVHRTVNAALGSLDVDRSTGDVALWMQSDLQDPQFAAAGLWLLSPDATTASQISLPGLDVLGPPRFLRSWRRAPANETEALVR